MARANGHPRTCICEPCVCIHKPQEHYLMRQRRWVRKVNLKGGDHVLILREASHYENGWSLPWAPACEAGYIYQVVDFTFSTTRGIPLRVPAQLDSGLRSQTVWCPYFVLKKVDDAKD